MNDIKLIFRENMDDYINPLKEKGCNIWSISRINNFNTCPRQYYYTYIKKEKQKLGVYSTLGSACHSDLEDLYEGKTLELLDTNFKSSWEKCKIFGVEFPKSRGDIGGNYKKDIDTFYKHYTKMNGNFISELGFILKVNDMNYIMGYIDLIEMLDDGKVKIYDFKTSAMFEGGKIIDSGRQLAIYQMAMEQLYGLEVVLNGWIMLKYMDVKIGKNKVKKALKNREMVSKCESQIKTLMAKKGYDDGIIQLYIAKCRKDNDIMSLPKDVKDEIDIDIHFKEYVVSDEVKKETMKYIEDSINKINSIDKENKNLWECQVNDFFCRNLCGFYPKTCTCE